MPVQVTGEPGVEQAEDRPVEQGPALRDIRPEAVLETLGYLGAISQKLGRAAPCVGTVRAGCAIVRRHPRRRP